MSCGCPCTLLTPEIQDLHRLARDEHVGWLDVAVHDAARVRSGQPREDLQRVVDGARQGEGATIDDVLQRGPFGQLHDEERLAAFAQPAVEHANHVGVLDAGGRAGLGDPPLGRPRVPVAGPTLEHLHGDGLLRVDVVPAEHRGEGPGPEHRDELVAMPDAWGGAARTALPPHAIARIGDTPSSPRGYTVSCDSGRGSRGPGRSCAPPSCPRPASGAGGW